MARARNLGYVVVGGRQFPVMDIRLEKGAVWFRYRMAGPQPALAGNVTLFGADGQGCWQGHWVSYPELRRWEEWVVDYSLQVVRVETLGRSFIFGRDGRPITGP